MRSDGSAPKNGEPTVGFSFTTMLKQNGRVLVKDFLAKNSMMILGHPPYSPDLIPANVYLFGRLKSALKEWQICDVIDIITNATKELKRLSQNGFEECFQHLYSHWQKCIAAQGDYFEGNVALYFSQIRYSGDILKLPRMYHSVSFNVQMAIN